jgi:GT2 family glycosyltransferase
VPRLSIIIPLLGDTKRLDDTLVSVLEHQPVNCEIIVVHSEPYEDPYQISSEVRLVRAPIGADEAECLNLGLSVARSPVVHVLEPGVEVAAGWAEAALRHLSNAEVAAVATVVLDAHEPQRVLSAGLGYRPEGIVWRLAAGSRPASLAKCVADLCGPDPTAAFYCRSALQAAGGFAAAADNDISGIELSLRLRLMGFRCALAPDCIVRTDAALTAQRPGFRRGRDAERLFWRWASSVGRLRAWPGHAALLLGECVLALGKPCLMRQLLGRACGALLAIFSRRANTALRPATEDPAASDSPPPSAASIRKSRRGSAA